MVDETGLVERRQSPIYRIAMGASVGAFVYGVCGMLGVPQFLTGFWTCLAWLGFSNQLKFDGLWTRTALQNGASNGR